MGSGTMTDPDHTTRFVSLGMVVLDELHLPDNQVLHDLVGGSGAYSTLGARIIMTTRPQGRADQIGSFIMAGNDFPEHVVTIFRDWGITVQMEIDRTRESTRGVLVYHDEDFGHILSLERNPELILLMRTGKSFRYATTPLQPTPAHLPLNLLTSTSFHLLYPPAQASTQISELLQLRTQAGIQQKPLLVWEPFPRDCTPENLEEHIAVCKEVDVFSPNHLEILALFGKPAVPFSPGTVEECAGYVVDKLSESNLQAPSAVVVRSGEHGCLVVSAKTKTWLPPLLDGSRVVDATGAGNTFLGAFAVALQDCSDVVEAAVHASVAASFAIEQIGMPSRVVVGGNEKWNGEGAATRLEKYQEKIKGR